MTLPRDVVCAVCSGAGSHVQRRGLYVWRCDLCGTVHYITPAGSVYVVPTPAED